MRTGASAITRPYLVRADTAELKRVFILLELHEIPTGTV